MQIDSESPNHALYRETERTGGPGKFEAGREMYPKLGVVGDQEFFLASMGILRFQPRYRR